MEAEETITILQDVNGLIRALLHFRRHNGFNDTLENRLRRLLEQRRLYRSDKTITVWVLNWGEGDMCYDDKEEMEAWLDDDPSLQPSVTTMTGREYGQLPVWDY